METKMDKDINCGGIIRLENAGLDYSNYDSTYTIGNDNVTIDISNVTIDIGNVGIAKIYNDEKHLFQENAKCTLYGTSVDFSIDHNRSLLRDSGEIPLDIWSRMYNNGIIDDE